MFWRPGDYGQCPASYSLVQTVLTPHGREIARLYGLPRQKRLEVVLSPDIENFKSTRWRLASSLVVRAQMAFGVLESELHAVERVPAEGRSKPTQFIYKPLADSCGRVEAQSSSLSLGADPCPAAHPDQYYVTIVPCLLHSRTTTLKPHKERSESPQEGELFSFSKFLTSLLRPEELPLLNRYLSSRQCILRFGRNGLGKSGPCPRLARKPTGLQPYNHHIPDGIPGL